MDEVIVERLNQPPFSRELTLVTFDELAPFELTELLNDVFATLDGKQKVDMRDEKPNVSMKRMLEFLRILGYRPQNQYLVDNLPALGQGILNGDREIVYPILAWIFENWNQLLKRVQIAPYLVPVDIPQEFYADELIVELDEQLKILQEEFKKSHKNWSEVSKNSADPELMKKKLKALEEEKDSLNNKLGALRRRAQSDIEKYDEIYPVVKSLRKEMEEQKKLQDRLTEQKEIYSSIEKRVDELSAKKDQMRMESNDNTSDTLVSKMTEDLRMNKYLLTTKLPNDSKERREVIQRLQEIVNLPTPTEDDINKQMQQIQILQREIQQGQITIEQRRNPEDNQLTMFRRQAAVVAKKKEEVQKEISQLNESKAQYEKEVIEKEQAARAKGKVTMSSEEFMRYFNDLRQKAASHKRFKLQLASIRSERALLLHTESLLKAKVKNMEEYLNGLEKKAGVQGAREVRDALEKIAEQQGELNDFTGKTMEEISMIVRDINTNIKDRKNDLAPRIKNLRQKRHQMDLLQTEYDEKKRVYDNAKVGLESERGKLENDVTGLRKQTQREESRYFYLKSLLEITNVSVQRVANELKAYQAHASNHPANNSSSSSSSSSSASSATGSSTPTYREIYQQKLHDEEMLGRSLREQQKEVKEKYDSNVKQAMMFMDMAKILHCKLTVSQNLTKSGSRSILNSDGIMIGNNVMNRGNGGSHGSGGNVSAAELISGVDRLVL